MDGNVFGMHLRKSTKRSSQLNDAYISFPVVPVHWFLQTSGYRRPTQAPSTVLIRSRVVQSVRAAQKEPLTGNPAAAALRATKLTVAAPAVMKISPLH